MRGRFPSGIACAAALLLASTHSLADEVDTVSLAPSSKWHLEFADNSCRLSRQFGSESEPSFLSFEQIAPGSTVTITVAGPDVALLGQYGDLTIGVRPDGRMTRIFPMRAELSGYGEGYILTGLSFDDEFFAMERYGVVIGKSEAIAIDLEDAGAVTDIILKRVGRTVSFETDDMTEPFRALNACTIDLLEHWDLRIEDHSGHRPVELLNERFEIAKLRSKFARTAGKKGHEALLNIRALIEPDGSVSDCVFEFAPTTGGDQFDACAAIREMRFRPALTAGGETMRSFFALAIPLSWVDPLAL